MGQIQGQLGIGLGSVAVRLMVMFRLMVRVSYEQGYVGVGQIYCQVQGQSGLGLGSVGVSLWSCVMFRVSRGQLGQVQGQYWLVYCQGLGHGQGQLGIGIGSAGGQVQGQVQGQSGTAGFSFMVRFTLGCGYLEPGLGSIVVNDIQCITQFNMSA